MSLADEVRYGRMQRHKRNLPSTNESVLVYSSVLYTVLLYCILYSVLYAVLVYSVIKRIVIKGI